MKNHNARYQLPTIYKQEVGKHRHRVFVFLNTTDDAIEAVAAKALLCARLEELKIWFEVGLTESDVKRYLGILESALPTERGIEITYETDIPADLIRMWYQYAQVEVVKRRALLN